MTDLLALRTVSAYRHIHSIHLRFLRDLLRAFSKRRLNRHRWPSRREAAWQSTCKHYCNRARLYMHWRGLRTIIDSAGMFRPLRHSPRLEEHVADANAACIGAVMHCPAEDITRESCNEPSGKTERGRRNVVEKSPWNGHGEEALRNCFPRDRALKKEICEGLLSLALGRAVQIGRLEHVQGPGTSCFENEYP